MLWSRWADETEFGGTTPSDTVGRMRFLPTVLSPGTYEFDVTLPPGTPFVVAPFPVFGETYDDPNVPDDNPNDPFLPFLFETTDIQAMLNGRVLLDGNGLDLASFMFGPVFFDEPVVYAEPQFRFFNEANEPVNSTAALFVVGIGTVYRPLPVGQHTLVNTVDSLFFGQYQFTYHITVSRR